MTDPKPLTASQRAEANLLQKTANLLTEARSQREWLIKECAAVGVSVKVLIGAPIAEAYRLTNERAEQSEARVRELEAALRQIRNRIAGYDEKALPENMYYGLQKIDELAERLLSGEGA